MEDLEESGFKFCATHYLNQKTIIFVNQGKMMLNRWYSVVLFLH